MLYAYNMYLASCITEGATDPVTEDATDPATADPTEPVAESLDSVDPLPYALVAVGLVVLLVLVIVTVLVVAILLW